MAQSAYPATLPPPSLAIVTPAERRLLSDLGGGPQQARGVQRSYVATQRVEFVFSAAEAAIFDAWWKTDLDFGGAWFMAAWPAPQGFANSARRFIGVPQWRYLPGGSWRVTAQVLVQTRALEDCFTETYPNGLTDFAYTFGSDKNDLSVVSSPYGQAFYAASTTTSKYISKDLGTSYTIKKLSFYLWLGSYTVGGSSVDDATRLALKSADLSKYFVFIPVREHTYDASQLVHVYCPGDHTLSPRLLANQWYYVAVVFDSANFTATIYNADTMAVHSTGTFSANLTDVRYEEYQVERSSGFFNVPTKYAGVRICFHP